MIELDTLWFNFPKFHQKNLWKSLIGRVWRVVRVRKLPPHLPPSAFFSRLLSCQFPHRPLPFHTLNALAIFHTLSIVFGHWQLLYCLKLYCMYLLQPCGSHNFVRFFLNHFLSQLCNIFAIMLTSCTKT